MNTNEIMNNTAVAWENVTRFEIAPFNAKGKRFNLRVRGAKGTPWMNIASITGFDTEKYQYAISEAQAYVWLGELMTAKGITISENLKAKIAECEGMLKSEDGERMLKKIRIVNAGEKAYLASENEKAVKRFGKMKKEVAKHKQSIARHSRKNPLAK